MYNNINNPINNNSVPIRKTFNTGKNIGILFGVSFFIFIVGSIGGIFLKTMSVDVELKQMMLFLSSFASIFKITIHLLILIIGIPVILIIGSKNKSNQ